MYYYTIYDKTTLQIKSVINTNIDNYLSGLDVNEGYISGKLNMDDTILVNLSGTITSQAKNNIPVNIETLSCYSDLSYITIATNIPENTKIYINEELVGETIETDSLELSLDVPSIYKLKFDNDLYNKSSQIFYLTAYEN
tara:strand:+ start:1169 stop:1588 length:420 start_codon:yes stop_codon:yes gene_type:complete